MMRKPVKIGYKMDLSDAGLRLWGEPYPSSRNRSEPGEERKEKSSRTKPTAASRGSATAARESGYTRRVLGLVNSRQGWGLGPGGCNAKNHHGSRASAPFSLTPLHRRVTFTCIA